MPKHPRLSILVLLLLFGIPLIAAILMFQWGNPLSKHTTQHGILITPPLDFSSLDLQNKGSDKWQGKWLILYVNQSAKCEAICEKNLYYLRQIKTAVGKHNSRVERAILTFVEPDPHLRNILAVDFAGTSSIQVSESDWAALVSTNKSAKLALSQNCILLVDPLGNIMMLYPQGTPPMDIFKDLERLLKLSRIG